MRMAKGSVGSDDFIPFCSTFTVHTMFRSSRRWNERSGEKEEGEEKKKACKVDCSRVMVDSHSGQVLYKNSTR